MLEAEGVRVVDTEDVPVVEEEGEYDDEGVPVVEDEGVPVVLELGVPVALELPVEVEEEVGTEPAARNTSRQIITGSERISRCGEPNRGGCAPSLSSFPNNEAQSYEGFFQKERANRGVTGTLRQPAALQQPLVCWALCPVPWPALF